ncbi:MAG: hypothetical protein WD872_15510 [Pirellulaceae bacterium]
MTIASKAPLDPGEVAVRLARALDKRGTEYALGGAIALGFWGRPRGTLDVDLTLFMPKDKPSAVVWELQEIGCEVPVARATQSLREHGFCSAKFVATRVDVFVPTSSFYDKVKARRRRMLLKEDRVSVLDAETLVVFKMMFFREQDLLDIKQILRIQGVALDRSWVREQVANMFGSRDLRIIRWDELTSEQQA